MNLKKSVTILRKLLHLRQSLQANYFLLFHFILTHDILIPLLLPKSGDRREVLLLNDIISFLISVLASVVAYYICKWLDGDL